MDLATGKTERFTILLGHQKRQSHFASIIFGGKVKARLYAHLSISNRQVTAREASRKPLSSSTIVVSGVLGSKCRRIVVATHSLISKRRPLGIVKCLNYVKPSGTPLH